MKKEEKVQLRPINVKTAVVTIVGDGDIVLNKMNASATRTLLNEDRKAQAVWEAQNSNKWEDIITSIHWRDGLNMKDTNKECCVEVFNNLLKYNAPCITAFGLKKSWCQAVVRNEVDTYATKFDNAVNVIAAGGLVPIKFAEWHIDERLMSPKRGAPVSVKLNHFTGWSADVMISYTDNVYSISEIVNIINLAGFGLGIGSGRTSGYGRYHVENIK